MNMIIRHQKERSWINLSLWLGCMLCSSLAYAVPFNQDYAEWKASQQQQDQRLKQPQTSALSSNHYLSRPGSDVSVNKVKLNSATAVQLQQLNGIGEKKALAIIEYRKKNGKFKSIDEIKQVQGIGPAIFEKNKQKLAL